MTRAGRFRTLPLSVRRMAAVLGMVLVGGMLGRMLGSGLGGGGRDEAEGGHGGEQQ